MSGEVDLDWADKSESRLDRVVGNVTLTATSSIVSTGEIVWPLIRLGMLVVEEIDDITTWNPPNLFDHDHLEEFEWMWLHQTYALAWPNWVSTPGWPQVEARGWGGIDIPIDCGVRRKLGKADHLMLVGQMTRLIDADFDFNAEMFEQLRCVFVN